MVVVGIDERNEILAEVEDLDRDIILFVVDIMVSVDRVVFITVELEHDLDF